MGSTILQRGHASDAGNKIVLIGITSLVVNVTRIRRKLGERSFDREEKAKENTLIHYTNYTYDYIGLAYKNKCSQYNLLKFC